jgi:hypothetical protein
MQNTARFDEVVSNLRQISERVEQLKKFDIDIKLLDTIIDLCKNSQRLDLPCIQETETTVKHFKISMEQNQELPILYKKEFVSLLSQIEYAFGELIILKIITDLK